MNKYNKIKLLLLIGMLCMGFEAISNNQNNPYDPDIKSYLDSMEMLFSDVPKWLTTVYDQESGGFYHNALMKNDPKGYEPDIQSMAMALNILFSGNITSIDEVSHNFIKTSKTYLYKRYNKETGLFLDPYYKERVMQSDRALGRSQGMALSALKKLNTDTKRFDKEGSVPEYLKSMDNFEKWFNSRSWDKTWTAFDHIGSQSAFIKRLPENLRDSVIQFVETYAIESQGEDGFWGEGQPVEVKIGGAVKYGAFCNRMGITLPNPDLIYKTLMQWFRDTENYDFTEYSVCPICVPRNAIILVQDLGPYLSFDMTNEEKYIVVKQVYKMFEFYKNADGGFMFNHTETRIYPLDINYGSYHNRISDINGTHLAIDSRKGVYNVLDMSIPKIESDDHLPYFIK